MARGVAREMLAEFLGTFVLLMFGLGVVAQTVLSKQTAGSMLSINGASAAVRLAPPYRVDITKFAQSGANRIEVLVYSALSNHYSTIPTRYQRPSPSGLLGPVSLLLENAQ